MKTSYLFLVFLLIFLVACASAQSTQPAPPPSPSPAEPGETLLPNWTDTPSFTFTPEITQTITPTCTKALFISYVIQPGDTCSTIAESNGITVARILQYNPGLIIDCTKLPTGKSLKIPTFEEADTPPELQTTSSPTLANIVPTSAPTQILQPTWTTGPLPTQPPQPTQVPAPTSSGACCKHCGSTSQACGDTCISKTKTCHTAPGCACS